MMAKQEKRKKQQGSLALDNCHAREDGISYGQYQRRKYQAEHPADREKLRNMQPVYVALTGEYLCPTCAANLTPYRNCGKCGKVIIWKKG